jgi:ATP-binding cassette subfamily B protein
MKVMLNGTDALWRLWLGFFREHFAAIMSLVVLLPLSIYFNWRLAILLFALCVVFTVLTTLVVRTTYGMQSEVEAHYSDLSARASDALGSAWCRASAHRAEVQVCASCRQTARGADAGAVVVGAGRHHRASTTITVLAIFTVGIACTNITHQRRDRDVREISPPC